MRDAETDLTNSDRIHRSDGVKGFEVRESGSVGGRGLSQDRARRPNQSPSVGLKSAAAEEQRWKQKTQRKRRSEERRVEYPVEMTDCEISDVDWPLRSLTETSYAANDKNRQIVRGADLELVRH